MWARLYSTFTVRKIFHRQNQKSAWSRKIVNIFSKNVLLLYNFVEMIKLGLHIIVFIVSNRWMALVYHAVLNRWNDIQVKKIIYAEDTNY